MRHHTCSLPEESKISAISEHETHLSTTAHSNSHSEEPKTSLISRLRPWQHKTATHFLENQRQASSADLRYNRASSYLHSKEPHKASSAGLKTVRYSSHSPSEELRMNIISMIEAQ